VGLLAQIGKRTFGLRFKLYSYMFERIQVRNWIERGLTKTATVLVETHSNMKNGRMQDLFSTLPGQM
jgi:hypothetical protein